MASSRLGPLAGLARRIAAPKSALPLKGGGGGPVPLRLPPNTPVRVRSICRSQARCQLCRPANTAPVRQRGLLSPRSSDATAASRGGRADVGRRQRHTRAMP
jgi:hypothetical protein